MPQPPPAPALVRFASSCWRRFRRVPWWVQALGWLFGFWLLGPLLAWKTRWHWAVKSAITAVAVLFVIGVASSSGNKKTPATQVGASVAAPNAVHARPTSNA